MRIGQEFLFRVLHAHQLQQFEGAIARLFRCHSFVEDERFSYLFQHGMEWIECKHRLLENHADAVASYLAKRNITGTKKLLVVKLNAAARVPRARVGQ